MRDEGTFRKCDALRCMESRILYKEKILENVTKDSRYRPTKNLNLPVDLEQQGVGLANRVSRYVVMF